MDMRYVEYLKTDWWKGVREKHLVGHACAGCDKPATELHHVTYVNLGKETSLDVLPLWLESYNSEEGEPCRVN